MRDGEIDLQDAPVGDLARVVGDLNRFGVAGLAAGGHLVMRGRLLPAGIAGNGAGHAVEDDDADADDAIDEVIDINLRSTLKLRAVCSALVPSGFGNSANVVPPTR